MGRKLITVVTDCDLAGHVADWPALDALALREVDQPACWTSTSATVSAPGARSWKKRWARGRRAPGRQRRPRRRPSATPRPPRGRTPGPRIRNHHHLGALRRLAARLQAAELVALDTETDSLDPHARAHRRHLVRHRARPRRLRAAGARLPGRARPAAAATRCWPGCGRGWKTPARAKLGQNIKYDAHVCANAGISVRGYAHDTLLQSYVLEAHRRTAWKPGRAPPGPQGPELRRPVRQGRQPDPVRAGRRRRAPPSIRAKTAR